METRIVPQGPLGFVCWIDNQFIALLPDGKFHYGAMQCDLTVWLEITDLNIRKE